MALSNFTELKSAIADWLERSDLAARIPDFIALAEVSLNRRFRGRMNELNGSLTAIPGSRLVPLPAGFAEAVSVHIAGCPKELGFVDPALIELQSQAGRPDYWTIEASDLAFERPSDQAYAITFRYLKKFTLSEASPTNALLTDYPDLYLFGALIEAAPFLRDADLLGLFQGKYDAAIGEANRKEGRNRAQSRLRVDPALRGRGHFDIRAG